MRGVSLLFSSSLLLLLTSNPSFSMMEKDLSDPLPPPSKSTLKPLAKKNDANAQYQLGMIYLRKDLKQTQAIHWLERAAELENVPAQNQLIQIYLLKYDHVDGGHLEKDIENVIKWAKRASKNNSPEAQHAIGCLYRRGVLKHVSVSEAEPVNLDISEVKRKLEDAQHELAVAQQSPIKAVGRQPGLGRKVRPAAEAEQRKLALYQLKLSQAQQKYNEMYKKYNKFTETQHEQRGVEQPQRIGALSKGEKEGAQHQFEAQNDFLQMVYWWRLSADQGYARAQHDLGWAYETGTGVNQDLVEAVSWYGKAARNGYPVSGYSLKQLISLDDALPDGFFVKNK